MGNSKSDYCRRRNRLARQLQSHTKNKKKHTLNNSDFCNTVLTVSFFNMDGLFILIIPVVGPPQKC